MIYDLLYWSLPDALPEIFRKFSRKFSGNFRKFPDIAKLIGYYTKPINFCKLWSRVSFILIVPSFRHALLKFYELIDVLLFIFMRVIYLYKIQACLCVFLKVLILISLSQFWFEWYLSGCLIESSFKTLFQAIVHIYFIEVFPDVVL